MKAWIVHDVDYYSNYPIIVFAETRGKAISTALHEDEFEDFDYIELTAKRFPEADKMYQANKYRLDWDNSNDRYFLIEHGYSCDEDYYDPDDCVSCVGKDICEYYKYRLDEED